MSRKLRIIAITNVKGGATKTTSCHCIGAGLAMLERDVLLIDLDPQGDLTEGCGLDPEELGDKGRTIYDVLHRDVTLNDILVKLEKRLYLAPSCTDLAGAETEFVGKLDQFTRLKEAINGMSRFSYILIDCPPSTGQLTLNALTAASEIFIPITSEYRSFRALNNFWKTLQLVKGYSNKDVEVTGVIAARFDSRKNLNKAIVEKMKELFGDRMFKTLIRENVALAEAPAAKNNIFVFRGNSYGAKDYLSLCKEIIEMEESK
jgi:chromosome partitioning protein